MNKKQKIQNQIEKLKEEVRELEKVVEKMDKGSEKNWRAEEDEKYYLVEGKSVYNHTEEGDVYDNYFYNTLNYFKTEQEAKDYKEYLLAVGKVTRAIWEANGDWRVTLEDTVYQYKYYIYWDYGKNEPGVGYNYIIFNLMVLPYIKNENTAQQIIKDYKPELKIIFNYQRDRIN